MATYYVKNGGNDLSAGTSAATAWATIAKALGATGIASGDTLYIAPGIYSEQVTIGMTSATATTSIIGNPTGNLFPGVTPAPVIITNLNTTLSANSYAGTVITSSNKNFLNWQNISFKTYGNTLISASNARNWSFSKCIFTASRYTGSSLVVTAPTSLSLNLTVSDCSFLGGSVQLQISGNNVSDTTSIQTSVFVVGATACILATSLGGYVSNCTFIGCADRSIHLVNGSLTFPLYVQNSLFIASYSVDLSCTGVANSIIENYNRLLGPTTRQNVADNLTSSVSGDIGIDVGESLLCGLNNLQVFTSSQTTPNKSFGTASNAPVADMYDVTWTGTSPDAGSGTYRVITSNPTNIAYNGGAERNASTITIAPGSTSQSIELYLGATGLTASTSGLSAWYNRTRTASVSIPLVARTIAQAWTSGGFAEVDATNMPGVYRLDLPDAALAAGADDVTIVVRGASGTNGAVMTVKLSSGGLTSAQTAAAVWDAAYTSHTAASSFGARTLLTTANNRPVVVGTSQHIHANVHAIVDSTIAADELSGALLHNGTDYISAELLSPVSAATSVHIGPYQLLADGLGADQPLDVNVGTATSIDVQVTDANGTGIDITGATVSAKVYNSGGTLVATYAGTATYADNGRLSFGLTTTVTNTSGTYTVTVTRTTGATDTQIFGPLRLYVRPV